MLWGMIGLYALVFITFTSFRHYNFYTQTWDMGAFVQTMWNTTQGRIMYNNIEEAANTLGVHLSPWLFMVVPGYMIFQSPYYLLVVQSLALALGALPLFFLALKKLNDRKAALLISASYLLYPALHWINAYDFHAVSFAVPLMLGAFYFLEAKQYTWMYVFLALAASTREDVIIVIFFFGLFLLFQKEKRLKHNGIIIASASLLYFILAIKVIMPALGGGLLRLDRYEHLGSSISQIALTILQNPKILIETMVTVPKITYVLWLFIPVAFLPFFSWRPLILLIPGLLENLLTTFPFQFAGLYQYDSVLVPCIFAGVVYGTENIYKHWPKKKRLVFFAIIAAFLVGYGARSPLNPFFFPREIFRSTEHTRAFRAIARAVPPGATVAAHTNLVPHLSHREHSYMLADETFDVDYVLVDSIDPFGFNTVESFQNYVYSYMNSPQYQMSVYQGRYFIFNRKDRAEPLSLDSPE